MSQNRDLVTLAEAERELKLRSRVLASLDQRIREGAASDMPAPVVHARSVRLWSMSELAAWWPTRRDGRSQRGKSRANVSNNN